MVLLVSFKNVFSRSFLTYKFFKNKKNILYFHSAMETDETESSKSTIKEGLAEVETAGQVFYNPVQEFNRDLSIAVLNVFASEYEHELKQSKTKTRNKTTETKDLNPETAREDNKGITILEALSATGLRSIRYAKEVVNVKKIVANDISIKAVQDIRNNIARNSVEDIIEASCDDASMVMYKHKKPGERFSAVDLDPYGSPQTFLDGAVQCVEDGGLLLVTATDMAVLCGNTPETCYYKYGAVSLRMKCCHEMALRILLQCIESHANRYGRYIVPLLSIAADFYIRVFVKVYTGPIVCKKTTSKLSHVYECVGCETFHLHPLGVLRPSKNPNVLKSVLPVGLPVGQNCEFCQSKFRVGGPIWSAPIHDESFVSNVLLSIPNHLGTIKRIQGVLTVIKEELIDTPLYYTLDRLCSKLHIETPSMLKVRSAILNAGYKVSFSHANKTSIKTDAPPKLLWDILRDWETTHPVNRAKLSNEDPAVKLLSYPKSDVKINWDLHPHANPNSRKLNLLRYQENPVANWGPGMRATAMVNRDELAKSRKNQGKYSKKRNHSPNAEETEKQSKQKTDEVNDC